MAQTAGTAAEWTVGRLLQWTEKFFAEKGIESPRLDAEVLLAHGLRCKRIDLYARSTEDTDEGRRSEFRGLVKRRVEGCPVAYLVGEKEFYLLKFEVGPDVLVPRPATESLVMKALDLCKSLQAPRILDVSTGSGCIAISIAHQHRAASVVAVDTSEPALAVAMRNAVRHGVSERIQFLRSDLYAALNGGPPFDVILSNPPYIPTATLATLSRDVREHEPRVALDGGADGLAVFDRLIAGAVERLAPGGWLLVEIGFDQEPEAARRIAATPGLTQGPTARDGDGHPRVVAARRSR
jgi:release factor glutamine methyltransferase